MEAFNEPRSLQDSLASFKGLRSYQVGDEEVFRGRKTETRLLAARVLGSAVTLLHAKSGAGKTSLLNAGLVPALERKGWIPIVTRVGDNPLRSIEAAVVTRLLPSPETEADQLEAAVRLLFPVTTQDRVTLVDLAAAFDQAPAQARRQILAGPAEPSAAPVDTALRRLLRGGLEIAEYAAHVNLIAPPSAQPCSQNSTVAEYSSVLRSSVGVCDSLRASLVSNHTSLTAFLTNAVTTYRSAVPRCRVVLVLDQFEELFTTFGDSQRFPRLHPFVLRQAFVEQLRQLFESIAVRPGAAAIAEPDLRVVLSLRSEFLADAGDIMGTDDHEIRQFRLTLLNIESARRVLELVANGNDGLPEPVERTILQDPELQTEGEILPVALQLVCDWLDGQDSDIAKAYDSIGRATGILAQCLSRALDRVEETYGQHGRSEALEMLGDIVSEYGKLPQPTSSLYHAPLRDATLREAVVNLLEKEQIVQRVMRTTEMLEIQHDFLIRPILDAKHSNRSSNRLLLDTLRQLQRVCEDGRPLSRELFESAQKFQSRIHFVGPHQVAGVRPVLAMLRAAVSYASFDSDETERRSLEVMRHWHAIVAGDAGGELTVERLQRKFVDRQPLEMSELRVLRQNQEEWVDLLTNSQLLWVVKENIRLSESPSYVVQWAELWKTKDHRHE